MTVVPLSWTVSARSGDVSFTFKGGSVFPGWICAELRREAAVEWAVCAAPAMMDAMVVRRRVRESGTRLRAFGY